MSDDLHKLEIIRLLSYFFNEDKEKCIKWLSCPSLEFGGHSPTHLIKAGKAKTVLDHVRKSVFEYSWPEGEEFDQVDDRLMH